jgi:hypothetical protein
LEARRKEKHEIPVLYRERNNFHVDRPGARYGPVGGTTLFDIEPHGFEDAGLGFLDGISESIHSRKIVAIGVIFPAFTFNRDGVRVHLHDQILS